MKIGTILASFNLLENVEYISQWGDDRIHVFLIIYIEMLSVFFFTFTAHDN